MAKGKFKTLGASSLGTKKGPEQEIPGGLSKGWTDVNTPEGDHEAGQAGR